jgi:hypothetical protein
MAKIHSLEIQTVDWAVFSAKLYMEMMPFATFTLLMHSQFVVRNVLMVRLGCHSVTQPLLAP